MPNTVDTLREIHRLRKLIANLREQIEGGPAALAAEQARVAQAETDLRDAQDKLKHLKVAVHERETTLKATHQQIAKYEKQRETATSKKEMDAFEHEISHARQKVAELEEQIFADLGEIDERTANLPELEKALARIKQESTGFQKEADERQARLARELELAAKELAEAEKTLPADIKPYYDRQIAARGPDALAKADNRTCMACYGSLTLQHQREVEAGRFVTCKICGRILYV